MIFGGQRSPMSLVKMSQASDAGGNVGMFEQNKTYEDIDDENPLAEKKKSVEIMSDYQAIPRTKKSESITIGHLEEKKDP